VLTSFEATDGTTIQPEVYPRPDGTIYLCGLTSDTHAAPEGGVSSVVTTEAKSARLRQIGAALCPELRADDVDIVSSQACFLPVAADQWPAIGAVPKIPGLFAAVGHTWWGS